MSPHKFATGQGRDIENQISDDCAGPPQASFWCRCPGFTIYVTLAIILGAGGFILLSPDNKGISQSASRGEVPDDLAAADASCLGKAAETVAAAGKAAAVPLVCAAAAAGLGCWYMGSNKPVTSGNANAGGTQPDQSDNGSTPPARATSWLPTLGVAAAVGTAVGCAMPVRGSKTDAASDAQKSRAENDSSGNDPPTLDNRQHTSQAEAGSTKCTSQPSRSRVKLTDDEKAEVLSDVLIKGFFPALKFSMVVSILSTYLSGYGFFSGWGVVIMLFTFWATCCGICACYWQCFKAVVNS